MALEAVFAGFEDVVLVLLDVQIPGVDGFERALKKKQIPDCKDLPIIFISQQKVHPN